MTLGDNEDLFQRQVLSKDNFFAETSGSSLPTAFSGSMAVSAKIRYAAKAAAAVVTKTSDGHLLTTFEEPQRAAAPGQSIVFYDGGSSAVASSIETICLICCTSHAPACEGQMTASVLYCSRAVSLYPDKLDHLTAERPF